MLLLWVSCKGAMESEVINSVSFTIEWAKERLMDETLSMENAAAIAREFREWLDSDEIDLLYLDRLD